MFQIGTEKYLEINPRKIMLTRLQQFKYKHIISKLCLKVVIILYTRKLSLYTEYFFWLKNNTKLEWYFFNWNGLYIVSKFVLGCLRSCRRSGEIRGMTLDEFLIRGRNFWPLSSWWASWQWWSIGHEVEEDDERHLDDNLPVIQLKHVFFLFVSFLWRAGQHTSWRPSCW